MEVPSRYEKKTELASDVPIPDVYFRKPSGSLRQPIRCAGKATLLGNFPEAAQPVHCT
jgi:hypothetical protein